MYGLVTGKPSVGSWTAVFLATTILTSLSGFPLPPFGLDPPRLVGILSLLLLAAAVIALSVFRLNGAWRWIYIVGATAALYLNVFVGVIQAFAKLPFLHARADPIRAAISRRAARRAGDIHRYRRLVDAAVPPQMKPGIPA